MHVRRFSSDICATMRSLKSTFTHNAWDEANKRLGFSRSENCTGAERATLTRQIKSILALIDEWIASDSTEVHVSGEQSIGAEQLIAKIKPVLEREIQRIVVETPELSLPEQAAESVLVDTLKDCLERITGRSTETVQSQGNLYGYKGAIFENLAADILAKMGRKLYYYHKDSGLEIDFVMRYAGQSTLLEVKATTGNTKSAKTILNHPEKYHVGGAIKLGDYNVGRAGNILTLPFLFLLWHALISKEPILGRLASGSNCLRHPSQAALLKAV